MYAQVGDQITVKGRHQGDQDRHGEVLQVDGPDGMPPYLIRWENGHDSLLFPSSDAEISHRATA